MVAEAEGGVNGFAGACGQEGERNPVLIGLTWQIMCGRVAAVFADPLQRR
jgi:hypothetical protein